MKFILFFIIVLVCVSACTAQVMNFDVLCEKLNAIQRDVADIKQANIDTFAKQEAKLTELDKAIVIIKLEQATQATKLNIIWGIFGTMVGGSGVALGSYARKNRRSNE